MEIDNNLCLTEEQTIVFNPNKKKKKNIKKIEIDENFKIYESWLDKFYKENPETKISLKKNIILQPKIENTKTTTNWLNYMETCKKLGRTTFLLEKFILEELKPKEYSINAAGAMIIKGRYKQSHILKILNNFVKKYVTCSSCFSNNTNLKKENKFNVLLCLNCLASKNIQI